MAQPCTCGQQCVCWCGRWRLLTGVLGWSFVVVWVALFLALCLAVDLANAAEAPQGPAGPYGVPTVEVCWLEPDTREWKCRRDVLPPTRRVPAIERGEGFEDGDRA